MMQPPSPLRFPPDFPPSGKWDRFFQGVRWLGPDQSFFNELAEMQRTRGPESMSAWGSGDRRELALVIGEVLALQRGWATPYFLPDDSFLVTLYGPSGDPDATDVSDVLGHIEEATSTALAAADWRAAGEQTLGEIVDALLRRK